MSARPGSPQWPGRARPDRPGARSADAARSVAVVAGLLAVALRAGPPIAGAIDAVATALDDPVARVLGDALDHGRGGVPLSDSLRATAPPGPAGRLHLILADGVDDGLPLVAPLSALAAEARDQRLRIAEAAARRLSVLLLLPLVLCMLPAFALVTVVPLLVTTLGGITF